VPPADAKSKKFLETPLVIFFLSSTAKVVLWNAEEKRTRLPNKESDSILSESSIERERHSSDAEHSASIRCFIWCWTNKEDNRRAALITARADCSSKTCLKSLAVQRHGKAAEKVHTAKKEVSPAFWRRTPHRRALCERERDAVSEQTALLQGAQKEQTMAVCARCIRDELRLFARLNQVPIE
jgi:hypothetical protein